MTYKVKRIDHIGIVVNNFDEAKKFFEDFGFINRGEQDEQSELLDKVVGVKGAKSHIVFLESPGGQLNIELTKFINPETPPRSGTSQIYNLGIQHICLVVEGIDEIVDAGKQKGWDLITKVVNYENVFKLCYFRGPDKIILELAQKL